jgi:hypothetical protein
MVLSSFGFHFPATVLPPAEGATSLLLFPLKISFTREVRCPGSRSIFCSHDRSSAIELSCLCHLRLPGFLFLLVSQFWEPDPFVSQLISFMRIFGRVVTTGSDLCCHHKFSAPPLGRAVVEESPPARRRAGQLSFPVCTPIDFCLPLGSGAILW